MIELSEHFMQDVTIYVWMYLIMCAFYWLVGFIRPLHAFIICPNDTARALAMVKGVDFFVMHTLTTTMVFGVTIDAILVLMGHAKLYAALLVFGNLICTSTGLIFAEERRHLTSKHEEIECNDKGQTDAN